MKAMNLGAVILNALQPITYLFRLNRLRYLFSFTLLLWACQEQELIEPQPAAALPFYVVERLSESAQLARANHLVERFQATHANRRTSTLNLADLDWETAKVTVNNLTGIVHYAFPIAEANTDYSTTNLIIQDLGNVLKVFRLRFVPSHEWLLNADESAPFEGELQLLHWNGAVAMSETIGALANGRVTAVGVPCVTYDQDNELLLINLDECEDGESWENPTMPPVDTIDAGDSSGGGGSGTGSSTGGSTGGNPTDGSTGTGGGTPSDGGTPTGGTDGSGNGSGPGNGGEEPAPCVLDANGNCVDVVEPVIQLPENLEAIMWATNNVELDSTFENNPCAKEVYDKLMENHTLHKLLKGFNNSDALKLKFQVGDIDNNNDELSAYGVTTLDNGVATITINSNMLKSEPKVVAAVILHEVIHAEIMRALEELNDPVDILNTGFWDLLTLFSDYALDEQESPFTPFGQHAIMIERYRGVIKTGLFEFTGEDPDKYNSEIEALSWGGLIQTLIDLHDEDDDNGFDFIGDSFILEPGELVTLDQLMFYRERLYLSNSSRSSLFQDGPCDK
ncbi:MAG: hypothetical protein ACPGJS_00610 [Flammeovirgaceae bacterium]